jgi:hypothetical protein
MAKNGRKAMKDVKYDRAYNITNEIMILKTVVEMVDEKAIYSTMNKTFEYLKDNDMIDTSSGYINENDYDNKVVEAIYDSGFIHYFDIVALDRLGFDDMVDNIYPGVNIAKHNKLEELDILEIA